MERLLDKLRKVDVQELAETGEWHTIKNLSQKLGVAKVTILNRIRKGQFEGVNFEGHIFAKEK